MLENSFDMRNTDLRDEIQSNFSYLCEVIEELKAGKAQSSELPLQASHRPTGIDLVRFIIKPLAQARNDVTKGYNRTYRLVYSEMGVGWNHRLSRYVNKYKVKNRPSKMTLLLNDSKLLSLFEETVSRLLEK